MPCTRQFQVHMVNKIISNKFLLGLNFFIYDKSNMRDLLVEKITLETKKFKTYEKYSFEVSLESSYDTMLK